MTLTTRSPAPPAPQALAMPLEVMLGAAIVRTLRRGGEFHHRPAPGDEAVLQRAARMAGVELAPSGLTVVREDDVFVVSWTGERPGRRLREAAQAVLRRYVEHPAGDELAGAASGSADRIPA
ncbi:hypothetical protein ETD86_29995 [Nonomuraea turkmeniaca]|uniref:Uncharacterized protein n=1 Tax=Nonomuraea turkmeniaca TaxID=103838 RepID=A0A5S4FUE6_9ACTN|nr:hypothetical protein [Nonomuraea turkmeniaca]TMR13800.1 hypothetical protein ETD86_29995 [Nonomuraea turkmeniaca]